MPAVQKDKIFANSRAKRREQPSKNAPRSSGLSTGPDGGVANITQSGTTLLSEQSGASRNKFINRQLTQAAQLGDLDMLFELIETHVTEMNGINLATAFHRVAKLATVGGVTAAKLREVKNHPCFQTLLAVIERHVSGHSLLAPWSRGGCSAGEMPVQCMSIVAWTCATLRIHNAMLFRQIAAIVTPRLDELKPFELSNFVWAYAKVHMTSPELFKHLIERLLRRYDGEFKVQCLSTIAWCFATAQWRASVLFASLAEELTAHAHEVKPQEISTTLWAFAKNRCPNPMLFDAFGQAALWNSKVQQFKLQELSNTAWAFATVGHQNVALMLEIEEVVLAKLPRVEPQSIANMAWAFTKLQVPMRTDLLNRLFVLTMAKQHEFKPEELSALIWAASQSCPSFAAFFDVSLKSCVERLAEFSATAVANLAKTFSSVSTDIPSLYVTILQESWERRAQLQPHALCNLLQGSVLAATVDVYAAQRSVIRDVASEICEYVATRVHELRKSEIQAVASTLRGQRTGLSADSAAALERALTQRAAQPQAVSCGVDPEENCCGNACMEYHSDADGCEDMTVDWLDKPSSDRIDKAAALPQSLPTIRNVGCASQDERNAATVPWPVGAEAMDLNSLASNDYARFAYCAQVPWTVPDVFALTDDMPWKVPLPSYSIGPGSMIQTDVRLATVY